MFDPKQFGATPFNPNDFGATLASSSFNPADFGTTPVQPEQSGGFLGKVGGFIKNRFEQALGNAPEGSTFEQQKQFGAQQGQNIALGVLNPESGVIGNTESGLKALAPRLLQGAEKNVSRIFGATTRPLKQLTEKITPQFIEKAPSFFSRKGLQEVAKASIQKTGDLLEEALKVIKPNATSPTEPILNAIERAKNEFVVDGKVINAEPYQKLNSIQEIVRQFGDNISDQSLKKIRQIWDTAVTAGGKTFGRTISEGTQLSAQREGANAIRNELAKKYPEVAKVNAEYSFWKNVDQIIGATLERTKSQVGGLRRPIARVAGEVVGLPGGPVGSVVTGEVASRLQQLFDSALYNRVAMSTKRELSRLLSSDKAEQALKLLEKSIISVHGRFRQSSQ